MVASMMTNFRVNASRIFTTGHSNGGMFSETLACSMSDVFAAAASVSGVTVMEPGNDGGLKSCTAAADRNPSRRPNVLLIHGDADWVVPWTGDAILGFPTVPDNLAAWRARNGCSTTPVVTINTQHFKNELNQRCYTGLAPPTQVEVVRVLGGEHKWPVYAGEFEATKYVLDFFQRTVGF